jgi:hypothetical protein
MAYTKIDIVTKFRKRYSDCTEQTMVALLNEACVEIFSAIPYRRKITSIDLVQDTQTYALAATDSDIAKIWSVRYVRSADKDDFVELQPTSTDELDAERRAWRGEAKGTPGRYWIGGDETLGGVVGLFPKPDKTTDLGYPVLEIDASTIPTFTTAGNETLPDIPFVLDALVDLMCFKRAKDAKVGDAAAWKTLSEDSMRTLAEVFWGMNPRMPQKIVPVVRQRPGWGSR